MMPPISQILGTRQKQHLLGNKEPKDYGIPAIHSGLVDLDAAMHGLVAGRIHVIAARPGTGLSAVLRTIAANALEDDVATLFFTLGRDVRSEAKIIRQAMSCQIKHYEVIPSPWTLRAIRREEDHSRQDSTGNKSEAHRTIGFSSTEDLFEIVRDVFAFRTQYPDRKLLVVLDVPSFAGGAVPPVWAHAGEQLLSLARASNAAIIVSTRLMRSLDHSKMARQYMPLIVDIEDFGGMLSSSGVVVAIHRPDYLEPDSLDKGTLSLRFVKNNNARAGFVRVVFDPELPRVFNMVRSTGD